jgi:hypothetical protein
MTQLQEVTAGSSMGSGNHLALHFGVGDHRVIEELVVIWPDNLRQSFQNIRVDKHYQVHYPISPGQQYHNLEFAPNPGVNEIPLFITSIAILFALTLVGQLIERGEIQDE